MKHPLFSAALLSLLPMAAHAGGPTAVAPEPAPVPAPVVVPVTDWSGTYVGLSAGIPNGHMAYYVYDLLDAREKVDGSLAGAYAGFNIQRGSFVYGGELAYSTGDVEFADGYGFTDFLDVKARAGYATGKTLVYGTLGWTRGTWKEEGFSALSGDGIAYGAGVDIQLSDRMTLGVEYLWRSLETENFTSGIPSIANTNVHGDFGTLSLRLGFRF